MAEFLLASASPRRAQLLREAGYVFRQQATGCAEVPQKGEDAEMLALRLAQEKAIAGMRASPSFVVLAADTVVAQDERIYGKPADYSEYEATMRKFSDARHEIVTAVCIAANSCNTQEENPVMKQFHCRTEVEFGPLDRDWIRDYWESHEPRDKAGGYAIQGLCGTQVRAIYGSYTNVVGLPMVETRMALAEFDVHPQKIS